MSNNIDTYARAMAHKNSIQLSENMDSINEVKNKINYLNLEFFSSMYPSISLAIEYLKEIGGGELYIPKGIYNENLTIDSDNITLRLDNSTVINGKISIEGEGLSKANSIQLQGTWINFPIGTTTFNGDFSGYSVGDKVVIETTDQDASINQIGIDFATVQSASSSSLTITTGTRFGYNNPIISKIENAIYNEITIQENDYAISGDYTSFLDVGDIVRIENIAGTSGVENSNAYFELNKVIAIDNTKVTFENRFTHGFSNFWIVKLNCLKDIKIIGGKINTLYAQYISDFQLKETSIGLITDSEFYTASLRYLYKFLINDVNVNAVEKPIGIESVYNYNGLITNINVNGAKGSTDNSNIKIMSNVNVTIDSIVSLNTQNTSIESVNPFMIDYYYTPYKCWNNKITIDSLTVSGNKAQSDISTPDFWIIGIKNSVVNNITCNNTIRVTKLNDIIMSNIVNNSFIAVDTNCANLILTNFQTSALDISSIDKMILADGMLTGKDSTYSRIIYVHGTCSNITFRDIDVATSSYTTIYLQDVTNINIDGVKDKATGTYSVEHGVNVVNAQYGVNRFSKLVPINTTGIGITAHYGTPKGINMPIFILGRNSYVNKGNITGDGTAYKCVFDGDGLNFSNKNNVTDLSKFTVPVEMGGNYLFTAAIGIGSIGTSHTLAEFYIRKNNSQNYYLDYKTINTSSNITLFLQGSIVIPLVAGDYIELYVKVSGSSKVVTWTYSELGGHFAGTLLFAQ